MSTEHLDLNPGVDRRVFIRGMGYVSTAVVLSFLGGCEKFCKQIRKRPTRRRLRTGSADVDEAIAIYKDGVSQMKALPASNPRSWAAQAALHGTIAGGFNFCEHGSDHFFSWHRAYLLYFEKIIQELTKEKRFGLPYWNWNQDSAMHPEFTAPGSPLFHPRNNTSVAGVSAFTTPTLDPIVQDTNFYTFSSQIEGTPHNTLHGVVGQDMVTGGSPLDPIFWMHHCMVDYCWAKWNNELDNDNTNDPGWMNTSWGHFVDGDGNPVNVSAGLTTIMPLLVYQYESSAIGSAAAEPEPDEKELKKIEERVKKGAEMRFEIKKRVPITERTTVGLARPFHTETRVAPEDFAALLTSDRARERIFVSIEYAQLPPANDFYVRVFLNLPTAGPATSTDDPHYAGSFAFFGTPGTGHAGHGHKTDFLVNVTDVLQRLTRSGEMAADRPISVQLVAVPATKAFVRPDAELVLEKIELIVSPVLVRSR